MADTVTGATGDIVVEGAQIFYRLDGPPDAPVLVFSNSLGTDLRMWEPQLPPLAARFRVLRYDSRGHGHSSAPPGPYTLDQLGGDLLALLDALGVRRAYLCGLSLGGMVAQWIAIHHPERVGRVVLANTAARIGTLESWTARIEAVRAGGMPAIRDAVVARFLSERFRNAHPEVTQWLSDMVEATPPEGYLGACEALRDADLRALIPRIAVSTLIIASELDESTPPTQARELLAAIAGSELEVFAETAHLSNVEQPELFTRRVLDFLTR